MTYKMLILILVRYFTRLECSSERMWRLPADCQKKCNNSDINHCVLFPFVYLSHIGIVINCWHKLECNRSSKKMFLKMWQKTWRKIDDKCVTARNKDIYTNGRTNGCHTKTSNPLSVCHAKESDTKGWNRLL